MPEAAACAANGFHRQIPRWLSVRRRKGVRIGRGPARLDRACGNVCLGLAAQGVSAESVESKRLCGMPIPPELIVERTSAGVRRLMAKSPRPRNRTLVSVNRAGPLRLTQY